VKRNNSRKIVLVVARWGEGINFNRCRNSIGVNLGVALLTISVGSLSEEKDDEEVDRQDVCSMMLECSLKIEPRSTINR
jgi:hypothetical protein